MSLLLLLNINTLPYSLKGKSAQRLTKAVMVRIYQLKLDLMGRNVSHSSCNVVTSLFVPARRVEIYILLIYKATQTRSNLCNLGV